MKIVTYLLLACLIFGIFKTQRTVRQSQSARERSFVIRMSVFSWLVGTLLLSTFLFLPYTRQRILFLIPAFVIVVTIAKLWQNNRLRLRRERQEQMDLERMKRVN